MIRSLFIIAAILTLTACASMSVDPQADYGTPPPANYPQIVKSAIGSQLKDADSAQYDIAEPAKGYVKGNGIQATTYGYLVAADVNARNSFGGYTGGKRWYVFFDGSDITALYPPDYLGVSRIHYLSESR